MIEDLMAITWDDVGAWLRATYGLAWYYSVKYDALFLFGQLLVLRWIARRAGLAYGKRLASLGSKT